MAIPSNATVRQGSRRAYTSGGVQTLDLNSGGEALFAQGLPERAELTRLGRGFSAQIPAASAWTLLITIPTTRSELAVQNPNSTASKTCFIIDRFWVKAVTSMASACALTPLSQLVISGTAMVADNAAVLRTNLSGSSRTSSAYIVMASVITGCLTDKWNHHGSAIITPTTNIAATIEVPCYGRYIVPPGGSFNISAQESVSGGTAIAGVEYFECEMDLG